MFYALFGTLSFVALKPMLDVIFDKEKQVLKSIPKYTGFDNIGDFAEDFLIST